MAPHFRVYNDIHPSTDMEPTIVGNHSEHPWTGSIDIRKPQFHGSPGSRNAAPLAACLLPAELSSFTASTACGGEKTPDSRLLLMLLMLSQGDRTGRQPRAPRQGSSPMELYRTNHLLGVYDKCPLIGGRPRTEGRYACRSAL